MPDLWYTSKRKRCVFVCLFVFKADFRVTDPRTPSPLQSQHSLENSPRTLGHFVWLFLLFCCLRLILLLVMYEIFENKDYGSPRELIVMLTDVHQKYIE